MRAYVGLGSNVGDRFGHLRAAVDALRGTRDVFVRALSPVYESPAHRLPGQSPSGDYLNAVVGLDACLPADDLLGVLLDIERQHGRERPEPWAPRTLDLDLLLYGHLVRAAPGLVVPHPRLALRRFVLAPLADLAPDLVIPGLSATARAALAACPDPGPCRRLERRLDEV